jgi:hypothetical protein
VSKRLSPVYACVQAGHAVAQYLLEHPQQEWNNEFLIYLYADVDKWKYKLRDKHKEYSSFYEPDLGNTLTAIAVEDSGEMFKNLKLVQ